MGRAKRRRPNGSARGGGFWSFLDDLLDWFTFWD